MNAPSIRFLIATIMSPLVVSGCAPNGTGNNIAKAVVGTALQAVGIDTAGAALLVGTVDNVNRSIYTDRAMSDAADARAAAASDAIAPRKGNATETQLRQMFPNATIPVDTVAPDSIPTKEAAK